MTPPGSPVGQRAPRKASSAAQVSAQLRRHRIGPRLGGVKKRRPTVERQDVWPLQREIGAGEVHARERLADLAAVADIGAADPQAVEKGDDGGAADPRAFRAPRRSDCAPVAGR